MQRNLVIGVVVIVIAIIAGSLFFLTRNKTVPSQDSSKQTETEEQSVGATFENPKKSAHYESNTPEHGTTLAGVPINVVIDFNFDLAKPSHIKIMPFNKGQEIFIDKGVGETVIDDNKLSMRRNMDPNSPDDFYTVVYSACWPDGSCHDGSFQFAVDRAAQLTYEDLTNQSAVTIKLSNIKFVPVKIKISKGTNVTWVNDDDVIHYVNTDSHPAHTYYPKQNSEELASGESFSLTFDQAGVYPYHCSAHASSMVGSLLVE